MKTAFIGAGPGCKAIIEMIVAKRFHSFEPKVIGVMDIDPSSVGFRFAASIDIPVFTELEDVLRLDGLEMVFELVGSDAVLDEIYGQLPRGVKVIDHVMARVFWELEESERRFRQIINTAHGAITIKDVSGSYRLANKRAASFFGLEKETFIGKTSHDLLPENVASLFISAEQEIIEKKSHKTFNDEFVFQGQEYVWVTERLPITDYQGNIIEVCSISRDVSDEVRLRQELIQSEKMATIGQLAAGVAHEINNPLTGILSFAENIKLELDPSDSVYDDMDVIVREAMRCRQIVRDLLDFSRVSAPSTEVRVNINDVIKRVVSIVVKQALFHDISIVLDIDETIPSVAMDPNQMQQVILNLIINAREAIGQRGLIDITTKKLSRRKKIMITITDNGTGIPEENLGKIFDPFFSTKGAQGNGLGLPTAMRIISAHGGDISIESKVGEGSTFRIEIPYQSQLAKRRGKS